MTTARLPYDLEQKLDTTARIKDITKSDMVKEALVKYLDEEETEKSSWETGEPYFGRYGSGDGNLSTDYKNRLREQFNGKYHTY